MASLSNDKKSGTRRIQFLDSGKRRTIRLGKTPKKAAESILARVEHLIAGRAAGVAIDVETANWLRGLSDDLHGRIARAGLAAAREARRVTTLQSLFAAFNEEARRDIKDSTRTRQTQAQRHLLDYFGEDHDADTIDANEADAWRAHLLDADYAKATVSRTVKLARQFFRWGIKRGLINSNPFADVRAGSEANPDRQTFVDRDTIARVMDTAPSIQWRLLIALSRYAGLRVPSEAFRLHWADIDWDQGRLFVRSPKTEHHDGGAGRWVPLFPEVREHLLAAFEQAEAGTERVLSDFRVGYNPHTELRRIITRAGVKAWPRAWHNLRGSRQSELVAQFPISTACAWLGNSRLVAAGHYITTTDADWQRAVGGGAESGARAAHLGAQHAPAPNRVESSGSPEALDCDGVMQSVASPCDGLQTDRMGVTGLEPVTSAM